VDGGRALREVEQVFTTALAGLRPSRLVREALRLGWDEIVVDRTRHRLPARAQLIVVAIGKAAREMAEGALAALGNRIDRGLIVTKAGFGPRTAPACFELVEGSHPIPDERSLAAGEAVLMAVGGLTPDDLVLVLLSGGGSALVEVLRPGITLDHLKRATEVLLRAGADIWVLNGVRRRLSVFKAGGLARAAAPARVVNLIISDVLGSPLPVIASGPSVDPGMETLDVQAAVRDLGVWHGLPASVRRALEEPVRLEPVSNVVQSVVLADARLLAERVREAAEQIGYRAVVLGDRFTGEAREFARFWSELARHVRGRAEPWHPPVCLVGTGELTVTVRGTGRGGRNTEMALAAGLQLAGIPGVAVASLASDGDDGVSGAAGGVVTGETAARIEQAGLDPSVLLADNDSARGLAVADALLITGPTGTNMNDLYLALIP
jgi:hydroxypyruvate reductase